MNRQTLVNTLLIIAGIVLAFALFAAGVFWHSRTGLARLTTRTSSFPWAKP